MFLLNTPIFTRLGFIQKRFKTVKTLLVLATVAALIISIVDYHPVLNVDGINVYQLNIIAALLFGGPSLMLGILASYSFFKVPQVDTVQNRINVNYLFSIGALILGISDFIYISAQNENTSVLGATIAGLGYVLFISIIVVNYLRKEKTAPH